MLNRALSIHIFAWIAPLLLADCASQQEPQSYVELTVDPAGDDVRMVWKDSDGSRYSSFASVDDDLHDEGRALRFAMNGGMFTPNNAPLGLYIEQGRRLHPLNKHKGTGNFAIPPGGIFALFRDRHAEIIPLDNYDPDPQIAYATQSAPLLVIDGKINDAFQRRSGNLKVRNGVCVLANGKLILSMSKGPVSFYDFAAHFQKAGCKNALYLDGAISQATFPAIGWQQAGTNLGVMIIVTDPAKPPHG